MVTKIFVGLVTVFVVLGLAFMGFVIYQQIKQAQAENARPGPTPFPTKTAEQLKKYVAEHSKPDAPGTEKTGYIRIGMTEQQCIAQRGYPAKINRTTTALGQSEQWCYGESCSPALYFENGTLTAIQD